ncbi:Phosphatidylinositol 4-kinase beta 1 [Tetrabaena socialis]|uniref:1-phosphatidylinositol 4-kinase n=1 Tax=Tetrabaena socialis TaxID=47790 RepID=A0A2J8ADY7_9CHLO|nr:Phosphatidylinositol 4-kinase beta 1 [Tetrabaena socialis]|eukprot:PNH10748.1 Phosphatidylinositol 4-kinase beta 1 [Tetrabaena socialis]
MSLVKSLTTKFLHQNTQSSVHDYLCNRLHELGEEAIEKYLLQFVYLAVSRPGQALERTLVDLCSKSFRVAIKVGSTTSGRASLPSQGPGTADTASTAQDTPGALSPAVSLSSQFRSTTGSPAANGNAAAAAQPHAAAPAQGAQPQPQQHAISAPAPTYPCSASYAGALEERASATLLLQQQQTAAAQAAAELAQPGGAFGGLAPCGPLHPALGQPAPPLQAAGQAGAGAAVLGSGPGLGLALLSLQAAAPQPMGAVVIPTRSASSSNIAAAAVAATMAATAGGCGGGDAASACAARGGGGVIAAAACAGGSLALTPRAPSSSSSAASPPSLTGLPPRPPPLPLGGMSPINAAKEVSPQAAAQQAAGGMLSASTLLRRVLGERAEEPAAPATAAASIGAGPGGAAKGGKEGSSMSGFSVVRSLCFSNPEPAVGSPDHTRSPEAVASAALAARASLPYPGSSGRQQPLPVGGSLGQRGLSAGGVGSGGGGLMALPRASGELTQDEMQELLASGFDPGFNWTLQAACLAPRAPSLQRTALIEMVPNTLSIHTIKSRSPPGTSLSDHFFAKFGRPGSAGCTAAQRRFTESLAAYSLICYLLQIKDRHNGNILLDDDGRIVHIDFGFLLSNSPGGVNFESAPFKLTRELLEVMDSNSDGRPSEMFDYFKVLMIQGFLSIRKPSDRMCSPCSDAPPSPHAMRHHAQVLVIQGFLSIRKQGDRVVLLVKMMSKSGFPCFKAGDRAVKALEKRLQVRHGAWGAGQALEKRLQLSLTEVQCVAHVLQLIAESLDAWRTRQYDYYQRVLNGIL